jgi:hypothetical protein
MDKVIFVYNEELVPTPVEDLPVLGQRDVVSYHDFFTRPGRINMRKLPGLEGKHFAWYKVEHHKTHTVLTIGFS